MNIFDIIYCPFCNSNLISGRIIKSSRPTDGHYCCDKCEYDFERSFKSYGTYNSFYLNIDNETYHILLFLRNIHFLNVFKFNAAGEQLNHISYLAINLPKLEDFPELKYIRKLIKNSFLI